MGNGEDEGEVPPEFFCPLSHAIMHEPVIVASGQSYERAYIEQWLASGRRYCPKLNMPLDHVDLVPNVALKTLISEWCTTHGVRLTEQAQPVAAEENMRGDAENDRWQDVSRDSTEKLRDSSGRQGREVTVQEPDASLNNSSSSSTSRREKDGAMEKEFRRVASWDGYNRKPGRRRGDSSGSDSSSSKGSGSRAAVAPSKPGSAADAQGSVSGRSPRVPSSQSARDDGVSPRLPSRTGFEEKSRRRSSRDGHSAGEVLSSRRASANSDSMSDVERGERRSSRTSRPSGLRRSSPPRRKSRVRAEDLRDADVEEIIELMKRGSLDECQVAVTAVRSRIKESAGARADLVELGGVPVLLDLFDNEDLQTADAAVTAVLTLCQEEEGEDVVVAGGIRSLVSAIKKGSEVSKGNAAAALFALAAEDVHRRLIWRAGAVKPLVALLKSDSARTRKDASLALFNLSEYSKCAMEIVKEGAVATFIDMLSDSSAGVVEKAMAVLTNLVKTRDGQDALLEVDGVLSIVDVLEGESERAKEEAVYALHHLVTTEVVSKADLLNIGALVPLTKLLSVKKNNPELKELYDMLMGERRGN